MPFKCYISGKYKVGTHLCEHLPESLAVLAVLLTVSAPVPLRFGQSLGEPLHFGPQFPHIPLQLQHLALPLRLAALELEPQLMLTLLQPLFVSRNILVIINVTNIQIQFTFTHARIEMNGKKEKLGFSQYEYFSLEHQPSNTSPILAP